jgi:HK97 family phage portal protein
LEKRSLFKKIFGREQPPTETSHKQWELISTSNSTFTPFDGNIFNNDIVRSALRPKANAVGKLNIKYLTGIEGEIEVKKLPPVLKRPNPYMSMQDFLTKMTYQRELNNNAFAYVKRDNKGQVEEIYPIHYSSIELLEVAGEVFCRFQFIMGKYMTVPYVDLIHLRKDFYKDDFFGENSVLALQNIMDVIVTTDQGIVNAVKNSAVIKWIMKFKSVLQPKDVELNVKEFTKNYLDINNTGGAAASDPRYDLEQVKEASFVPNVMQMKEYTQRLYSYFGVNDAIVQNKGDENQNQSFYEAEIEPILIQLSEAFTQAFFTNSQKNQGYKIVFEGSNLAYASMQTKLQLVAMVDRGAMAPNEWRRVLNLPPIEGGDIPIRRLDTATVTDGNVTDGNNDKKEVEIDE